MRVRYDRIAQFRVLLLLGFVFLQACASKTFYQLYVTQSNEANVKEDALTYENQDIEVVFNFWGNYGNSGFLIFNKTESNIYIDLKHSHLIVNQMAKTYFQNRNFTESSSSSYSTGNQYSFEHLIRSNVSADGPIVKSTQSKTSLARGYAVTYTEQDIICIPPQSGKLFDGFYLRESLYRDCDLFRYPSPKRIINQKFDQDSSPLKFENIISYSQTPDSPKEVRFSFWVSEISNYPESEFLEWRYPDFCGTRSKYSIDYFLYEKPTNFYIIYEKGSSSLYEH